MNIPVVKKYFVTAKWSDKYVDAVIAMKSAEPDVIFGMFFQDPTYDNYAFWKKAEAVGITVIDLVPERVGVLKLSDLQRQQLRDTVNADAVKADNLMSACEAMKFKAAAIVDTCYKFEF